MNNPKTYVKKKYIRHGGFAVSFLEAIGVDINKYSPGDILKISGEDWIIEDICWDYIPVCQVMRCFEEEEGEIE